MVGARQVLALPAYPFVALERQAAAVRRGPPVLRLAIGDPDLPPPPELLEAARAALGAVGAHRYSSSQGETELRSAFAAWFRRRFGVAVDPDREVAVLVGTKEGIAALPRALLDPGDRAAVPDPGYPAYETAVRLAGARPVPLPLSGAHGWRPRVADLPPRTRLVFLNYPNNPTGALVPRDVLPPIVEEVRRRRGTLAYDNAYSELTFGRRRAPSVLEVPDARDVAVEFHSLSKTLGIPGWRLGFAVGNEERIAALLRLKGHGDSGAARPLQIAAATLLRTAARSGWPRAVGRSVRTYGRRLRLLSDGLSALGFETARPEATLYLWQRTPEGDGTGFAERLLRTHRILVTPGGAFGRRGVPYVRWAVTVPEPVIHEAIERMAGSAGRARSPHGPGPSGPSA